MLSPQCLPPPTGQPSQRRVWPRVVCDSFLLIAAQNPCPCGYFGDPVKEWTCTPAMVTRYQKRISGPLLDRIDIHVEAPPVECDRLGEQ